MAIYHFSVKNISRGDGRSAVAAAAYRSGEKLLDERQGKEQDYTKKQGVEFSKIYTPDCFYADFTKDRQTLWNTVEQTEKRKDASLAREFEIAFPHELNRPQRQRMLDQLCNEITERHGVIVDAAIHAPHTDSGSDERNYHAHILFTSRNIDFKTQHFAAKKNRDFNKENSTDTVNYWRGRFEQIVNHHLEQAGHDARVDHRSYQKQGSDMEATQHEGSTVTQLRRMGIATEISKSNDAIKQRNAEKLQLPQLIEGLDSEIIATERLIAKLQFDQMRQDAPKTRIEEREEPSGRVTPQATQKEPQRETRSHGEPKKPQITKDRELVAEYGEKVSEISKQIWRDQLKGLKEQGMPIFNEIERLRKNEPLFFGRKQWEQQLNSNLAKYESIKQQHDAKKEKGVTNEHRTDAQIQISKNDPYYHTQVKQAIRNIKAFEKAQRDKIAKSHGADFYAQKGETYRGKILKSDENGILQQTSEGIVYHPALTSVKQDKSYTLHNKGDQYEIREDYEIWTRESRSQSKGR